MPIEVAKRIYRSKYWNATRCDDLPAGVDYAVFDYAVNSGVGRAGKVLRRLVGLASNSSAMTCMKLSRRWAGATPKTSSTRSAMSDCDFSPADLVSVGEWLGQACM